MDRPASSMTSPPIDLKSSDETAQLDIDAVSRLLVTVGPGPATVCSSPAQCSAANTSLWAAIQSWDEMAFPGFPSFAVPSALIVGLRVGAAGEEMRLPRMVVQVYTGQLLKGDLNALGLFASIVVLVPCILIAGLALACYVLPCCCWGARRRDFHKHGQPMPGSSGSCCCKASRSGHGTQPAGKRRCCRTQAQSPAEALPGTRESAPRAGVTRRSTASATTIAVGVKPSALPDQGKAVPGAEGAPPHPGANPGHSAVEQHPERAMLKRLESLAGDADKAPLVLSRSANKRSGKGQKRLAGRLRGTAAAAAPGGARKGKEARPGTTLRHATAHADGGTRKQALRQEERSAGWLRLVDVEDE